MKSERRISWVGFFYTHTHIHPHTHTSTHTVYTFILTFFSMLCHSHHEFSYIQSSDQQIHLIKYNKIFNCILLNLLVGQYIELHTYLCMYYSGCPTVTREHEICCLRVCTPIVFEIRAGTSRVLALSPVCVSI